MTTTRQLQTICKMLTRSQAKLQQQAQIDKPKQTAVEKPGMAKAKPVAANKDPVRLTEDLLYIVNKKLQTMDKKTRDDNIQNFDNNWQPWRGPVSGPFTEIAYRKQNSSDLSQTELAVMHKVNFDSNSTAVCKLNSMSQFFSNVARGAKAAKSADYRKFLDYKRSNPMGRVKCTIARFVQLPKDYYRPHSDCDFFGELAWKENGVMTVEADNFALCLTIWTLKEWLSNPIDKSYPLSCYSSGEFCCFSCRRLLPAMWTDDRLRSFLTDRTISEQVGHVVYDYHDSRIDDVIHRNYWQLERANGEIKNYARKLLTGEEMISRCNRSHNVLTALQLERIVKKLEKTLKCYANNWGSSSSDFDSD